MKHGTLDTARPRLAPDDAIAVAYDCFRLEVSAREIVSERDQNFHLCTAAGDEYVLKIANSAESGDVIDLQNGALLHIARSDPDLPVPRLLATPTGDLCAEIEHAAQRHSVRLISYLAGQPLRHCTEKPALLNSLGGTLARLGRGLRGYFHPAARRPLLWDLQRSSDLSALTGHVADTHTRSLAATVFSHFDDQVAAQLPKLRAQVIHNDFNPDNVLVDKQSVRVTGVIDFGDLVHGPLIADVAVACAYQLQSGDDPFRGILTLLSAYHAVVALEADELSLLFDLIATRVAATVTISSWRAARYPDNRDYILTSFDHAVTMLERLGTIDRDHLYARFTAACFEASTPYTQTGSRSVHSAAVGILDVSAPTNDMQALIARREQLLGPVYRLFYDKPLHIVRGQGVWLYDELGRPYLDVYNNVACVGHSRPEVVEALSAQARRLNTHTRYLHKTVIDYAAKLGDLFPFEDPVVMFCCTGSEANELAWRIAKAHTGGRGVVVTENAYHGNSTTVSQFSTADTPPHRREDFVSTVAAPDSYRGRLKYGDADMCAAYAGEVDTAIATLAQKKINPAALLVDTIFSCDGIVTAPDGYLGAALERIRAAGGVLIADEVQAGFGRTGEAFWGFERHGVVPDIVTLGKPMGNGHPVAAVVTTRKIVAGFAAEIDYFNTFGGNPVSAAVGLAVLDVLAKEQLQRNSGEQGAYLTAGLRTLQQRYALIGDVRGSGLFIGIELVANRDTLEPASLEARLALNLLRQRGVLIGVTGPHGNVLKIRPPLVFGRVHCDLLLRELEYVFGRLPAPQLPD